MGTSVLIGKLLAAVYISAGLGMIIRPAHYRKMMEEMMTSTGMQFYGGIMSLLVGLLIVLNHNIWAASWATIITVIGWLGLIKGVTLLAIPDLMLKPFQGMMKPPKFPLVSGVFALTLGLILGYFSFLRCCV